MNIVVVGAGPAGMTSALLLARAGHAVDLLEAGDGIGGLWASQLDGDGHFLADNSCKVYQPGYRTTPALMRMIGTDAARHFVQRHDLASDWLRPFMRDSCNRDLAWLCFATIQRRLGLGALHEVSVEEFLDERRLSAGCAAWMRATALGGIAGTMKMTVWELGHRLSSNTDSVFSGATGPLHWNAKPPNAPEGFLPAWQSALEAAGVNLRLGSPVLAVQPHAEGMLVETEHTQEVAEMVMLAVPPPAMARLLAASSPAVSEAFGYSQSGLQAAISASCYTHLGITWLFDQPLGRDLPLGGHNVRQGWHPILVQHDQYRAHLKPPAVTAVVGSVALDTTLRHHRLGTLAKDHTHAALAELLWEDERRVDPSLPEPIGFHIAGETSATQITGAGPLPMRGQDLPVVLATNLHGRAPYFTASLEAAIQAGALAAEAVDSGVERLPMPPPSKLPWRPALTRRHLELVTPLPCTTDEAWAVFVHILGWPRWSRYVRSITGEMVPGARWSVTVQAEHESSPTVLRPRLLSIEAGRHLSFASTLLGGLLRLEHEFRFEADGQGCVLRQPFRASGPLGAVVWRRVISTLREFEAVGRDLERYLSGPGARRS